MQIINFAQPGGGSDIDQPYLYFLALALVPDDFEELEGLTRSDIEWRFLALTQRETGAPLLVAFRSADAMMRFTKLGGALADLPRSTEMIRAETALLRGGPCPYDILLDPTADDFRLLLRRGEYSVLDEGLESLL